MPNPTNQRLASRSEAPASIAAGAVVNVATGLQLKDGTPLTPWFVEIESNCPFLHVLGRNSDASFDLWNASIAAQAFGWIAHHLHSEESEPIPTQPNNPVPSQVQPPALCPINPDFLGGEGYLIGEFYVTALETVQAARNKPVTTILTDEDPDALNTAIAAAIDGDVIEVQTNATYNPITIPAGVSLVIRAGSGFAPVLSGQSALQLANGAANCVIAGFTFDGCSAGNANFNGAAVSFATLNCIANNIYFDRCIFNEVENGSAVMLSYHWSQGGDLYYNPPTYAELSENIGFFECNFVNACKDNNEGAAINLRAVRRPFIYKCDVNGNNEAAGSRGIQLQNCPEALIFATESYNHLGANAEAFKFDVIGTPTPPAVPVYTSGHIVKSKAHDATEGIDIDDLSHITAIDNLAYDNVDEGISVDDSAEATLINNKAYGNDTGILLENGSQTVLHANHAYNNTSNNYDIQNGYTLPGDNLGLEVPTNEDLTAKKQGQLPHYLQEHHPAGEMWQENNSQETTIETPGTFVDVVNFLAGYLKQCYFANASQLRVCEVGWYDIQYHVSNITAQPAQDVEFQIAINGVAQGQTKARRRHASTDTGSISGGGMIFVADPSYPITIQVTNLTSATTTTIIHSNVRIVKAG